MLLFASRDRSLDHELRTAADWGLWPAQVRISDGLVEYSCNMGKLLSAPEHHRGSLEAAVKELTEVAREIVNLDWVSKTRIDAVLKRRQELDNLRVVILKLFNYYQRFPLLPGKCRFIDVSAKHDGL